MVGHGAVGAACEFIVAAGFEGAEELQAEGKKKERKGNNERRKAGQRRERHVDLRLSLARGQG